MLVHMLGGQPGRTPEILGLRFRNTEHGSIRNVFIERGMVSMVAVYHKNFRVKDNIKIIHRFLPRAVGELLVWYLWLIQPFWEQIQVLEKKADQVSNFLWVDEVASRKEQAPEDVGGEDEGYETGHEATAEPDQIDFSKDHKSKKWSSDKMRRVITEHSKRFTGKSINISTWRHLAIAIANRYLNEAFGKGEADEIDLDVFGPDVGTGFEGGEDNPFDL